MFITLEGPEGSGKTCQLPPLAEFLIAQGYSVLSTREPGGTQIGDQIRQVLLDMKNTEMLPRTEILLFQASRAQHVDQIIRPQLDAGGVVICDRFGDSTLAYQGYGYNQFDLEQLRRIISFATGGLIPDLTLLFDVDVEVGLNRRRRGGGWNRMDAYAIAFQQRVRQGYLEMARQEPQRWVVIDASRPLDIVQAQVRRVVLERLEGKK